MQTALWRKLWHLIGGSFFPILAFFVPQNVLLVILGTATALVIAWEIARFTSPIVGQWVISHLGLVLKSEEKVQLTASTYLLLASIAVFLLFEKYVAITSLLFLSIGDFMAAVVGKRFGRRRIFNKSLVGSLACLASCLVIGIVMTKVDNGMVLPVALAGAVSATIVELLPIPIDDNFTLPVVSAGIMTVATLCFN